MVAQTVAEFYPRRSKPNLNKSVRVYNPNTPSRES